MKLLYFANYQFNIFLNIFLFFYFLLVNSPIKLINRTIVYRLCRLKNSITTSRLITTVRLSQNSANVEPIG